jgi:glycosyltransferase involved in cell wall biosynthesis
LLEKKGRINPNTTFAPMGVDYQSYSSPVNEPPDMASIPRPRIGYTGVLKRQLDWPLLMDLADQHPTWSFVFVGPQGSHPEIDSFIRELSNRRNVYFLGQKPVELLAHYPQHFDVCIMPYRIDDYTQYIYPLKLHEYLASGQPIVGSRIRSLEEFADQVNLARTPEDWSLAIAEALSPLANDINRRNARQDVAKRYDWKYLIDQIAKIIVQRIQHP